MLLQRRQQPLDFGALWRVRRQPLQQLASMSGRGLTIAGSCVSPNQVEARFVKIWIQVGGMRERADRLTRAAEIHIDDAEIGRDDGILGLDAIGFGKGHDGVLEPALPHLAQPEAEMRISGRHVPGDRSLQIGNSLIAAAGLEQHVAEAQVGLRILRVRGKNLPQRFLERGALQLAGQDLG